MKKIHVPKDKGRTEMGEVWREFREEQRENRKTWREVNTRFAYAYASFYDLEIEQFNGGTQLRFKKSGKHLDYFPTSGKIKIGQRYKRMDLETEIKKTFNL